GLLSLYCSELQSTATSPSKTNLNDNKRCSRQLSETGKDRMRKKGFYITDRFQSGQLDACSTMRKEEEREIFIVILQFRCKSN
ncbi:unnamed protein product, partial [Linum tenue]